MRVFFVCNEYPPRQHGGIGSFLGALCPVLVRRDVDVTVVQFGLDSGETWREGVRVVQVPLSVKFPGSWLIDRMRLRDALLRMSKPLDVVEVHDFEGYLPFGLKHRLVVARLQLSSTARTLMDGHKPRLSVRWRERRTLAAADAWIGVSRYAVINTNRTFPRLTGKPTRIVYNPSVVEVTTVEVPRERFVLFAGYVSRSKGADRLARVMKPVMERLPDVRLVFAGRVLPYDATRDTREAVTSELGLELSKRCEFLGFVSRAELHQLMARAACFGFPSTLEMFPLVVGEAMLQGCPVVLPAEPPFDEYVRDPSTGILCSTDAEWSAALERLLIDREFAQQIGRSGRQFVLDSFSIERCANETLAFYEHLLTQRRGGGR